MRWTTLCVVLLLAVGAFGACDDPLLESFDLPLDASINILSSFSGFVSFVEDNDATSVTISFEGNGYTFSRDDVEGSVEFSFNPAPDTSPTADPNTSSEPIVSSSPLRIPSLMILMGSLSAAVAFFLPLQFQRIFLVVAVVIFALSAADAQGVCSTPSLRVIITTPATYDLGLIDLSETLDVIPFDPAEDITEPGVYSVPGGPSSDFDGPFSLTVAATSGNIEGAIGDGAWFLQSGTRETGDIDSRQTSFNGQSVGGVIATDLNGDYGFSVPLFCGYQLLKCVWNNDEGRYVIAIEVIVENCTEADLRVTLTWDRIGNDWDLHLVRPGGCFNDREDDCFWANPVTNWGAVLDLDCIEQCTTENIFLNDPEPGTYWVFVHHYSGDFNFRGTVTFNVGGRTYSSPIPSLPERGKLLMGTIEFPSGRVTRLRVDASRYDCPEANYTLVTLADRTQIVEDTTIYQYSLQQWEHVQGIVAFNALISPQQLISRGGVKASSLEFVREEGYRTYPFDRNESCYETESQPIAITRVSYSDSATRISVISNTEGVWESLRADAESSSYAEQPGVTPPFVQFPSSVNEVSLSDNLYPSNSIIRKLLVDNGIDFSELSGLHPGGDEPRVYEEDEFSTPWIDGESPVSPNGNVCA